MTILLGKGRRLTLDELHAASHGTTFEIVDAPEDLLAATFDTLSLSANNNGSGNGGDMLSPAQTKAALTLLAQTLLQGDCRENALAMKLVHLMHSNERLQLAKDATQFVVALSSLDDEGILMNDGVAKGFVGRVIDLTRVCLSVLLGECICSLAFDRLVFAICSSVGYPHLLVLFLIHLLFTCHSTSLSLVKTNALHLCKSPKPNHYRPTPPTPLPPYPTHVSPPPTPT